MPLTATQVRRCAPSSTSSQAWNFRWGSGKLATELDRLDSIDEYKHIHALFGGDCVATQQTDAQALTTMSTSYG